MDHIMPSNLVHELPAPTVDPGRTPPRRPNSHTTTSRPRRNDAPSTPRPKVSLWTHIKSHPSQFILLGLLFLSLVLAIAGLAVYMVLVPKANEGPFITFSLLFILIMIVLAGFLFRQSIILYNLIHPPPTGSNSTLPTWLTTLPTYGDVLRNDGQPTHSTGTEGWSGMLPSYGDAKGDELLMKSSMRDSRGSQDLEMGVIDGDVQMTIEAVESRTVPAVRRLA